jgi:pyridoxine kinase
MSLHSQAEAKTAEKAVAKGAVIVLSSHVMRGSVGNRAAVFALEALGFPVWAVPTIILPWHPGHGPSARIVPDPQLFRKSLIELSDSPWIGEVAAVLSGYLGDAAQAVDIAGLVGAVRRANPHALYLCDPVLGDTGGLYVPAETAQAMRDTLWPIADIATPNRFEFEFLTGRQLPDNASIVAAARAAPPPRLVVTSAHAMLKDATGNLLVTGSKAILAEHRMVENPPNGTGDLTAALLLARLLSGMSEEQALRLATSSAFEILARTVRDGAGELQLPAHASSLATPMAAVAMRQLETAAVRRR